jgi:hypothetical protein
MKIINIKKKALKSAILTVLFYVIYFLTSTIAEQFQKSICNPGLGMIVLLFLPIITFILLIFNLIKYYSQHKQYLKFSILSIYFLYYFLLFIFI